MIIDFVKGDTKVFGLLGNPVEHSISPQIHNTLSKKMGINSVYVPYHVTNLKDALLGAHAMGIAGLNVTIPFKKEVIPFLQGMDKDAIEVGAVNTLVRTKEGFTGCNTDILGVIKTFSVNKIDIENKYVLIIGAGGAAYAAAIAAARCNASKIFIANRTNKNAENVAQQLNRYYNVSVEVLDYESLELKKDEYALLIQTTSVGMSTSGSLGEIPIKSDAALKRSEFVFDMIYSPACTPLMAHAKDCGAVVVNGFSMLYYQAVAAFECWNNVTVTDSEAVKLEIRNAYGL